MQTLAKLTISTAHSLNLSAGSALGGFIATGMFLTTLTFILSTPGAVSGVIFGAVPALSVPGQFLLKDTVLLGVALQVLTESLNAIKKQG